MEKSNKKSLKWLWIAIAILAVVGIAAWCIISAVNNPKSSTVLGQTTVLKEGAENILNFNKTFVLFVIAFAVLGLGYLLGGINVKGITLGTAGVFLIAILVGYLCTLVPEGAGVFAEFHLTETSSVVSYLKGPIQNIGLILFVGSVGFIAGPNFFKNLAKNFKTYILLGAIIILSGTLVEQAKKKIRYLIQLTRVLMNSALDSYMQMLELIYTFVFSQAKTPKEIECIKKACKIASDAFDYILRRKTDFCRRRPYKEPYTLQHQKGQCGLRR